MSEKLINTPTLGLIKVKDCVIDKGSYLEEGIEITSEETPKEFNTIELIGFDSDNEIFDNPTYLENFILEY